MKIKFAFIICWLSILFIVCPAFALRPSKTPAAKKVMTEARGLLEKRDYNHLEEMLGQFLKNGDRVEDGQWKLHLAMDGIDGNAAQFEDDAASVERSFTLISDWVATKPESIMAKTALAHAWLSRAWTYRGARVSSETSQQQVKSFEGGLENAYQVLKEIGSPKGTNPELYMAWLGLAVGAGFPSEVTDEIYAEAKLEYPEYFYVTLQYLVSKFERWSGESTTLKNAIKPLAGDAELFARAIWHLVVYDEKLDILDASYDDAAKAAFSTVRQKYNSSITTNQIGYLACSQWRDLATFEKATAVIGNKPDLSVWTNLDNYNSCLNWAECSKTITKK